MTIAVMAFLTISAVVWLSVFGYLFALWGLARRREHAAAPSVDRPPIAVVIPTLNEAALIVAKLADVRRTDYPHDRLSVVVVDGGSSDRTTDLVAKEMERDGSIRLIRLGERDSGKPHQINLAIASVSQSIVVVTDVDAVLDPGCIGELVRALDDPHTAVVGATIHPASLLLEERIHWWLLNRLWWLEGEALSAALVSGVCYAFRRESFLPLESGAHAEDAHLALAAGARGFAVRLCRTAHATEVRVPQTAEDVVRFRVRRGSVYLRELLRRRRGSPAPVGWRFARGVRLWHFLVTPAVVTVLLITSAILLCSDQWHWPLIVSGAFVTPPFVALMAAKTIGGECRGWRIAFATSRLLGLTWYSLLQVSHRPVAGLGVEGRG
jgi:cellulose synthase/poly-beta-1,6-N-acetylglucosamine synthase-like glycosyltransferase